MKWGHAEAHLRGSNPNTWRWRLRECLWMEPELVVIVGAGAVALICLGAGIFLWLLRKETPPE